MLRLMSTRTMLTGALLVLGALAALMPLVAESEKPREIRIVARQMSFYVDGGDAANPTITVKPGERVRLTLVNEDAGLDHDFAVPAWPLTTPLVEGTGTTTIVFDAPGKPGVTDYVCSRHATMMTGTIEVAPGRTPIPSSR